MTLALIRIALRTKPPLGIFKNLVLEKDGLNNKTLNIKKSAISCIVDLVRIYSLMNGSTILNTNDRIEELNKNKTINNSTYQDLIETYHYVNLLRYQHQLKSINDDINIGNLLQPDKFGSFERQHLKDSFRIISIFQDLIKMKFGS